MTNPEIGAEALQLCDGIQSERTLLVALAMHAHICNISPEMRNIPPRWRRWLAVESVRDADAVLEEMGKGATE